MARRGLSSSIFLIATGFGCYRVSRAVEWLGDMASARGDHAGALMNHLIALLLLLAAVASFIYGLIRIVRRARSDLDGPISADIPLTRERHASAETPFDPDAVMSRYLAERRAPPPPVAPPPAARRGFGRKPV